jgi:phosphoglycolate phosphatase-like HAD superfamily hydrolase
MEIPHFPVKGIIFDVDGTLLDSNDLHAKAFEEAFLHCGYRVSWRTIRAFIGMGADHLIPGLIGKADAEKDVAKIGKIKSEMFTLHFLPKVKPFPKVRALLNHLNKAGFVLSVASSADTDELNKLLHIADVEDHLQRQSM